MGVDGWDGMDGSVGMFHVEHWCAQEKRNMKKYEERSCVVSNYMLICICWQGKSDTR